MFHGAAQPALDPLSPTRRIDFDAPVVMATIGGRPVVLARPDQRRATADEPFDLTVPLTMSRMRRAVDIERGMDASQYVPSPLFGVTPMYSLSGYYKPGLKFEEAQAIAATLTAEDRASIAQRSRAAMPGCYTQTFDDCVKDRATSFPNCADVNEGFVADWDGTQKLLDDMPFCPAPIKTPLLVAGALGAFVLGVGLGMIVSK